MSIISSAPAAGRLAALALAAWAVGSASGAQASPLVVTSQIQAQNLDDPGSYPTTMTIGTFTFIDPAYDTLIGASVSGAFGSANNPFVTSTAPGIYMVAGLSVFTCNVGDLCWSNSNGEVDWSYTFSANQLASLAQESTIDQTLNLVFNVMQTDVGNVNTDVTTLTLDFNVPEPATITLMAAGLLGLAAIRRSKRA